MRPNPVLSSSLLAFTLACLNLAGCGIGTIATTTPVPTQGAAISGTVHGGAQPISGAIDNAGSILVDNMIANSSFTPGYIYGFTGLTRFVGLATPTKTPNTGPPQAP